MQPLPRLFSAASGARFCGIAPQTFADWVTRYHIKPVAVLMYGREDAPLYSTEDVMTIARPYTVAEGCPADSPVLLKRRVLCSTPMARFALFEEIVKDSIAAADAKRDREDDELLAKVREAKRLAALFPDAPPAAAESADSANSEASG